MPTALEGPALHGPQNSVVLGMGEHTFLKYKKYDDKQYPDVSLWLLREHGETQSL